MSEAIRINLGGEGETPDVLNQQGIWVLSPAWGSAREGKSIAALRDEGHRFVLTDNRFLPFADSSIDEVLTNGVPIDGRDTHLGPPVQSSEIRRILKPGGKWFDNGVLVYEQP